LARKAAACPVGESIMPGDLVWVAAGLLDLDA
jgi:hypothetical protein